jgi:CheY-like chemotaxis protein
LAASVVTVAARVELCRRGMGDGEGVGRASGRTLRNVGVVPGRLVAVIRYCGDAIVARRDAPVTANQWISLLKAVDGLIGVLVWPALILLLLLRFREPIGDYLNKRDVSVKGGGVEFSAKLPEVTANLTAAMLQPGSADSAEAAADPSLAARAVARALPDDRTYRRVQDARVLWVDDNPDNNRYERQSLAALGVEFTLSLSTEDALSRLERDSFDLIISDMGRPPDARAGYTLLDALRVRGHLTPFIIYAGSRAAAHVKEALQHGAVGCTNSPAELIGLVTQALSQRG